MNGPGGVAREMFLLDVPRRPNPGSTAHAHGSRSTGELGGEDLVGLGTGQDLLAGE